MLIDWQKLLLDPLYGTLGVPATLTLAVEDSSEPATFALTVIDKTAGVTLGDHDSKVETLEPAACVRRSELTEKGISLVALEGAALAFNGSSWKVKSWPKRPVPSGAKAGELLLILGNETELDSSS